MLRCRAACSSADQIDEIEGVFRPEHLNEVQRLRQSRERVELAMKAVVERTHGFAILARFGLFEFTLKLAQLRIILLCHALQRREREAAFEQHAQLIDLTRCRSVERCDDHSTMRLIYDVAFSFKNTECFAHRCNAQVELLGDVGLLQSHATREAAGAYA